MSTASVDFFAGIGYILIEVTSMTKLTPPQYAALRNRSERTVRGWIDGLVKQGKPLPAGVERVGNAWAAPQEVWDKIAASKGNQGRRDRTPRTKSKPKD